MSGDKDAWLERERAYLLGRQRRRARRKAALQGAALLALAGLWFAPVVVAAGWAYGWWSPAGPGGTIYCQQPIEGTFIRVDTLPDGAEVHVAGEARPRGTTPCLVRVPKGAARVPLILSKPGYETVHLEAKPPLATFSALRRLAPLRGEPSPTRP